jgi:AcrR family transcriptional regulator
MGVEMTTKRRYRMVARAQAVAVSGERMLSSAWKRFCEGPYEQVRLADIATDAGVTVQTLYSRFGSKEDLFVAAWQWFVRPQGARRGQVAVGDFRTGIRALYDDYEQDGDAVLRLMAQEERIPAVREMIESGRAYHRDWVARVFAPLFDGLRPAARSRRHAELIVATDLLVWKLLRRDMGLGRMEAERIVAEMVTAFKGTD